MSPDSMSLGSERRWWGKSTRLLMIAVLLGLPSLCAAGGSEWIEVRSPHFSIYTDACGKRGQDIAARFEEMRAIFGTVVQQLNVKSATTSQIVAFRDTQEFRQFAPMWNGRPTEVAGLFVGNRERSFILLDLSMEDPWQIAFHEYTHQLIRANFQIHVDPWFDEGLAEYFSGTRIDDRGIRVGVMRADDLALLRRSGLMKVAELFNVHQDSRTYRENGEARSRFYAQSDLLMHFLVDRQLFSHASSYFDLVENEDATVEEAIRQAFGMSAGEMDRALRDYLNTEAFAERRFLRKHVPEHPEIVLKPLSPEDRQALLAEIHLQSPDYQDKALEELTATLRRNPADGAAARVLAYFYFRNQDFEQAERYFDMAAQSSSADARVHYYAAFLRSNRGSFGDPTAVPGIISELNAAILKDPSFAKPYALLGFAELYRGNTERGIALVQKSVNLAPADDDLRYSLARMYTMASRPDDAAGVLRTLLKTQDVELAPKVRQLLRQVEDSHDADRNDGPPRSSIGGDNTPVSAAERHPGLWPVEGLVSPVVNGVQGAIKFLKGMITTVDCSENPTKVITMVADSNVWTMRVPAGQHPVLIGTDHVSCSWNSKKVAVNYRQVGEHEGDLISLEVQ